MLFGKLLYFLKVLFIILLKIRDVFWFFPYISFGAFEIFYRVFETGTKEVKYEAISDWRGGGRNKGCGEI